MRKIDLMTTFQCRSLKRFVDILIAFPSSRAPQLVQIPKVRLQILRIIFIISQPFKGAATHFFIENYMLLEFEVKRRECNESMLPYQPALSMTIQEGYNFNGDEVYNHQLYTYPLPSINLSATLAAEAGLLTMLFTASPTPNASFHTFFSRLILL